MDLDFKRIAILSGLLPSQDKECSLSKSYHIVHKNIKFVLPSQEIYIMRLPVFNAQKQITYLPAEVLNIKNMHQYS